MGQWLVQHPSEAKDPYAHRSRREAKMWPACRGFIVSAENRDDAKVKCRAVLLQEDPEFRISQFEEEKWVIRELSDGEVVNALDMSGAHEGNYADSPYRHGIVKKATGKPIW